MNNQYTLKYIADFLSAELIGNAQCNVRKIAPLHSANSDCISFLEKKEYRSFLETTKASAIILRKEDIAMAKSGQNLLIVKDPYVAYAKTTALFVNLPKLNGDIHHSVMTGKNCIIDASVTIGANCVIGNNVSIGKNTVLHPGCIINDNVIIGDNNYFYANIVVYHNVHIGSNCIIHSGVVIGADGFGMANENGVWHKIHQLGSVLIGNDVEIGANTTIDRGALENTTIGNGVKLDNQIQIAHNVVIGDNTAIAGCSAIAGSTKIGKCCMIGGGANINGHIEIASGTIITGCSNIYKTIEKPDVYASVIPAVPHRTWWRVLKNLMKIDDLINRVKALEKKIYE